MINALSSTLKGFRILVIIPFFIIKDMVLILEICYIIKTIRLLSKQRGGGLMSELVLTFFVSVAASIVSYYICRWLSNDI